MAFEEYHDMYLDCQLKTGKYFMVCFDLVDSRNHCGLSTEQYFQKYKEYYHMFAANEHHYKFLGDAISFIYCKEEPIKLIIDLIQELKKVGLPFHISYGWFDTINWIEGNHLYYGGYLFQELMTKHKGVKHGE